MNAPTILHGLYPGLDITSYHRGPGISKSGLDKIDQSPYHYWSHYRDPNCPPEEPRTSDSDMAGALLHCALLEPDEFDKRYAVGPDVSRATKEWKTFAAEAATRQREAIKPGQRKEAFAQADAIRKLPEIRSLLLRGAAEVSAYWKDRTTDELCRCRPDWVAEVGDGQVILLDAKTYSDASPADFARQIARMRYHVQDAWYWDGYQHAADVEVVGFVFLAVELRFPYAACPIALDDESREAGRRAYRRNLDAYAECQRTDVWPGHPTTVQVVSLPPWALNQEQ